MMIKTDQPHVEVDIETFILIGADIGDIGGHDKMISLVWNQ